MMATKLGMMSEVPIVGCRPSMPAAEHAGQAGEIDAEAEIEVAQDAHVDAQHRDGFEIQRAGANAHAEPRAVQDQEQPATTAVTTSDHEQAISGQEEEIAG